MTQTGTLMGSGHYLSPEQASGTPVTAATDVYSLGVVLYELLTGDVPFQGDNVVAVAMRHVSDPPPSLLERRPEVPLRLALAVERALEKDPARRFASMHDFAAELRACLAELGSFDVERTFIAQAPVLRRGAPHRARQRGRPGRRVLYLLLTLLAAAAILAGALALGGSKSRSPASSSHGGGGNPVTLGGVTAYDPYGDNKQEHDEAAPNAADGNPGTYWETEHYSDGLQKPGVGVVLDAGRSVALKSLTVTSDTPGYTATVRAGASAGGPFAPDSGSHSVGARTTFSLDGHTARYYVVWITDLGAHDSVHVNEVTGRT
jgi:serine/threonine-protein kinase